MQGRNFFDEFKFEMTPLLKFFLLYFIGNTIIIFYKRLKNPPILNKILNKNDEDNKQKQDTDSNNENNNNDKDNMNSNKEKIN